MKVKSWKTAKLGRLRGMGNYVHIAEDADNSSILVLGRSGSGKTYALQQIEKNIAEGGGMVLVLNFNSTHDFLNYGENQKVKRINIRAEGYPFPLFCPMIFPDGQQGTRGRYCRINPRNFWWRTAASCAAKSRTSHGCTASS